MNYENIGVYLDLDGTLADLYGQSDWLDRLRAHDPSPYRKAKPLPNMRVLARVIHALQAEGIKVGIISWLSKTSTPEYDKAVTNAKLKWLYEHLGSVDFDKIHIVAYGTPKQEIPTEEIAFLFDDELKNRLEWEKVFGKRAYHPEHMIEKLKSILIGE